MCLRVCFPTMVMLFVYNLVYSLLGDFDALYLCVYVVLLSVIVNGFTLYISPVVSSQGGWVGVLF